MSTAVTAITESAREFALRMDPCDVLFFRDGRPFTEASHAESGLPSPQTLAGAVRTGLLEQAGCDAHGFRKLGALIAEGNAFAAAADAVCGAGWIGQVQVRGPWFCRGAKDHLQEVEVLAPVPVTLHQPKSGGAHDRRLVRLDPLHKHVSLPGWIPPLPGMRPLWSNEHAATQRTSGYLTRQGLQVFLQGGVPAVSDSQLLPAEEIYTFDHRTGIGVDVDRYTAEEGLIYGASFLALKPGFALYAEVTLPTAAPARIFSGRQSLPLGGEGRRVVVERVNPFRWPEAKPGNGQGTLVLLTTAGLFASTQPSRGWMPACFNERSPLLGTAVGSSQPVSGWDLASGGPKPNRFAVPAGSVYFLQGAAGSTQLLSGRQPRGSSSGLGLLCTRSME